MIIISPETALSTAAWIESPGCTKVSAAVTIPEPAIIIRKNKKRIISLFILIPPSCQGVI